MEPEEETRVARKETPDEGFAVRGDAVGDRGPDRQVFSITPTMKFVIAGYAAAVVGAIALVALMSMLLPGLGPLVGVIAGMAVLLIPAFYHIRQRLVRYTLTSDKLEIDSGFISRTTTNIPLGRVQDVTVRASIAQRLIGVGDVVVDNAGAEGGTIVMKNIDSPRRHADLLIREMGGRSI